MLIGMIRTIQEPRNAWILISGMILCAPGTAPAGGQSGGTSNSTGPSSSRSTGPSSSW